MVNDAENKIEGGLQNYYKDQGSKLLMKVHKGLYKNNSETEQVIIKYYYVGILYCTLK